MKIYKTQQEVENDIKDGVLAIVGDVKFECPISISASIVIDAGDINAGNITAWNINAGDINAGNITVWNINAGDIIAWNIKAGDINARNITAWNINAWNIAANDINAGNILYHAFCCVHKCIKCKSIKAKGENHSEPICLYGKLELIQDGETKEEEIIELNGKKYKLINK